MDLGLSGQKGVVTARGAAGERSPEAVIDEEAAASFCLRTFADVKLTVRTLTAQGAQVREHARRIQWVRS